MTEAQARNMKNKKFLPSLFLLITGPAWCFVPQKSECTQDQPSCSTVALAYEDGTMVAVTAETTDQILLETETLSLGKSERSVVSPVQSSQVLDTTTDLDMQSQGDTADRTNATTAALPENPPDSNDTVNLGGITIKYCPIWSCKNRCFRSANTTNLLNNEVTSNSTTVTPKCACDETCLSLGDCCVDFFSLCLNITDETDVVALLKQSLNQSDAFASDKDEDPWGTNKLMTTYSTCVKTPNGEKYSMVTSCPKGNGDAESSERCHDADKYPILQPYSLKDNFALTFRNVHCARCHGYRDDTRLIPWIRGVNCSDEMTAGVQSAADGNSDEAVSVDHILHAIRSGVCNYIYLLPEGASTSPRHCVTTGLPDDLKISEESTSGGSTDGCTFEDLLLCKSYSYETLDAENEEIRNPHCLKCKTGVKPVSVDLPCARATENPDSSGSGSGSHGGILALFGPEGGSGSKNIVIDGKTIAWPGFLCDDDEVFDDVFLVCRQLFCPPGYLPVKGKCTVTERVIHSGESQLFPLGTDRLYLTAVLNVSADCEAVKSVWRRALTDLILNVHGDEGNPDETSDTQHSSEFICHVSDMETETANQTGALLQASFGPVTNLTESLDILTDFCLSQSQLILGSNTIVITNYENEPPVLCPTGYPDLIEDAEVNSVDGKLYVNVDNQAYYSLYPLQNAAFRVSLDLNGEEDSLDKKYSVVLCIQPVLNSTLNCSSVPFDLNRTRIVNDTLYVTGTELSFQPSEYEVHERFVLVCSDFKNLNERWGNLTFFVFSSAQYYVSMALSLTSVACLLASLLAFCLISELRTLAGHMTAALAASLAIGQLLLLLDVDLHKLACSIMAAVCHFCWLAAFSWMTALALHMTRTFTGSLAAGAGGHAPKHEQKMWRIYSTGGWGLPAVVVAVCLTVDNVEYTQDAIGYGEPVCGWMSQVYVFLVPVALAIIVNIVCFIVILVSIERTMRATRSVVRSKQTSERRRLVVYAKMSSAMGFTWVFGFAAAFTGEAALWWGYVVLNGLQGVFITFSFFLNKRLVTLLKKKISSRSQKCRCNAATLQLQNNRKSFTVDGNKYQVNASQEKGDNVASGSRVADGSRCRNCGCVKETSFIRGGNSSVPSTYSMTARI